MRLPENAQELIPAAIEACKIARAKGWQICRGVTLSQAQCCALGALELATNARIEEKLAGRTDANAEIWLEDLDWNWMTQSQMDDFAAGFDSQFVDYSDSKNEWKRAGATVAKAVF